MGNQYDTLSAYIAKTLISDIDPITPVSIAL